MCQVLKFPVISLHDLYVFSGKEGQGTHYLYFTRVSSNHFNIHSTESWLGLDSLLGLYTPVMTPEDPGWKDVYWCLKMKVNRCVKRLFCYTMVEEGKWYNN